MVIASWLQASLYLFASVVSFVFSVLLRQAFETMKFPLGLNVLGIVRLLRIPKGGESGRTLRED